MLSEGKSAWPWAVALVRHRLAGAVKMARVESSLICLTARLHQIASETCAEVCGGAVVSA